MERMKPRGPMVRRGQTVTIQAEDAAEAIIGRKRITVTTHLSLVTFLNSTRLIVNINIKVEASPYS